MTAQIEMKPVLALLSEGPLETEFGRFKMSVFHDGDEQAVVLSMGDLTGKERVLCRIHSECISSHVFFGKVCDCSDQMRRSQALIQEAGQGIIIYLEHEGRGSGAAAHTATLELKEQGISQPEAYRLRGFLEDARRFDIAAKVLLYLKIKSVVLISSNENKIKTLEKFGIPVPTTQNLQGWFVPLGESVRNIIQYTELGKHRSIIPENSSQKWVMVMGDLVVDYIYSEKYFTDQVIDKPQPIMGGTGFNAALAFKEKGIEPIIFGKIGNDNDGRFIQHELDKRRITSLVGISQDNKPTGSCCLIYIEDTNKRWLIKEENNANDYDLELLEQSLKLSGMGKGHFIFIVGHPLIRFQPERNQKMFQRAAATGAKVILDIVPHNMYESVPLAEIQESIGNNVDVIIGEFKTLMKFIDRHSTKEEPEDSDWPILLAHFPARFLVVRYGEANIERQAVCKRVGPQGFQVLEDEDTGYLSATTSNKRGFGDRLTAAFLIKYLDKI